MIVPPANDQILGEGAPKVQAIALAMTEGRYCLTDVATNRGATRRDLLRGAGVAAAMLPAAAIAAPVAGFGDDFAITGTYIDAAYCHPQPRKAIEAARAYIDQRFANPQSVGPRANPRNLAVGRFAGLTNVAPADIAVVPSTMVGENMLCAALGIGRDAGVVTDIMHYDGSLAVYGELAARGTPVEVVPMRPEGIDLVHYRDAIGPRTKLIAISLVSSTTGQMHDLAALCEIAHAKGVLVYADIVQAAGAVPIDLSASGVDFACCGTYKWLMGEYGVAFLYIRPDRLERLKRTQVGWRQLKNFESHVLPLDTPGPAIGPYELRDGAVGLFEVATPAWQALAIAAASIEQLAKVGPEAIMRWRAPQIAQLRDALKGRGFSPLAPADCPGPIASFAVADAAKRFREPLARAGITVSLRDHWLRVSPSVYNSAEDITRLTGVLTAY